MYAEPDKIDLRQLQAMADACGVDFHWLATGRGTMLPPRTPRTAETEPPKAPSGFRHKS
jgi:hypothetical protein